MSVVKIQLPTVVPVVDDYQFEVSLSGRRYLLLLSWSGKLWYVDILVSDQDSYRALVEGQGFVLDYPLLFGCADPLAPPGVLLLSSATGVDPSRDLSTAVLYYYT